MRRIHAMAALGNIQELKELLDSGEDINQADDNGKTPLYYAAYFERMGAINFLSASGADLELVDKGGLRHQQRAFYDSLSAMVNASPCGTFKNLRVIKGGKG